MPKIDEAAFLRMRRDLDEVVGLPRRAAELFARRSADSLNGFAELLDQLLPTDPVAEERLARALHINEGTLRGLRAGRLDPYSLPDVEPLARVARLAGLAWPMFFALIDRDHASFADDRLSATARGGASEDEMRARTALRAAWVRAERDDPAHIRALME